MAIVLDSNMVNEAPEGLENVFWEDFHDEFQSGITAALKRYKTVDGFLVWGMVGRWNGSFPGGKAVNTIRGILQSREEYHIRVVVDDDDREIRVCFAHHDGEHVMNIYPMTPARLKKLGVENVHELVEVTSIGTLEDEIVSEMTPLRVPRSHPWWKVATEQDERR